MTSQRAPVMVHTTAVHTHTRGHTHSVGIWLSWTTFHSYCHGVWPSVKILVKLDFLRCLQSNGRQNTLVSGPVSLHITPRCIHPSTSLLILFPVQTVTQPLCPPLRPGRMLQDEVTTRCWLCNKFPINSYVLQQKSSSDSTTASATQKEKSLFIRSWHNDHLLSWYISIDFIDR